MSKYARFGLTVILLLTSLTLQSNWAMAVILAYPHPESEKEYATLERQALQGSLKAAEKMFHFFALAESEDGFFWSIIAAENGSIIGAYNAAVFLSEASWLDYDPYENYRLERKWFWLKRAAKGGNLDAKNELKTDFPETERMRLSPETEVRRWIMSRKTLSKFKRAAMLGSPEAAYRLYQHYSSHEKKQKQGLFWATIAAQNGHPEAPFIVGSLMLKSSDRENQERAIFWLRKAANAGNKEASKMLDQALRKKR